MSILTLKYDDASIFSKVVVMFGTPLNFKKIREISFELDAFVSEFKTLDADVQKRVHLFREPTSQHYMSGTSYDPIFFEEKDDTFTLKTGNFLYYGDLEKNILMDTRKTTRSFYYYDKMNHDYYYFSDEKLLQQTDPLENQFSFAKLNQDMYSLYTLIENNGQINKVFKNNCDLILFNEYYLKSVCEKPLTTYLSFNKKKDEPFSSLHKTNLNNHDLYTFQFKNIHIDKIIISNNLVASIKLNKAVFRLLRNHLSEDRIESLKIYFDSTPIPSIEKIIEIEKLLLTSNELNSLVNDRSSINILPINQLISDSHKKLLNEKNKINLDTISIMSALKEFLSNDIFKKLIKKDFIQLKNINLDIIEVEHPKLIINNLIDPMKKIINSIDFTKSELEKNINTNKTNKQKI